VDRLLSVLKGSPNYPGTEAHMSWVEEDGTVGVLVENWTGLYRVWFNVLKSGAFLLKEVCHADGTIVRAGTRRGRAVEAATAFLARDTAERGTGPDAPAA
jgi:hypothetical protein